MHKVLLSTGLLFLIAVSGFVGCADNATNPVTADGTAAAPAVAGGEITEEDARKIAVAEVPGKVLEIEHEKEKGTMVYEVEIREKDGGVKEVVIDANTGAVLEIEDEGKEDDDDGNDDDDGADDD